METVAKTVLIVEDNELNMRLFNDILQASGYQTLQAMNGADALQSVEENRPDLILMDIHLPDMTGLEVTRLIKEREHLRAIPIIAITASTTQSEAEKFLNEGCDGFIAKSIAIPTFLETIGQFLD